MKYKFFTTLFTLIFLLQTVTYAQPELENDEPYINAISAIMIDQNTGRVLYEKNADEQLYPASMTKTLTALLTTEYIKPDEVIQVGTEINFTPWDSALAGLQIGEHISGKNLVRSLIMPSGNEAANTVAYEIVKRKTGDVAISYPQAEIKFAEIMNERAKSLGATNSNFVTASGYHDDNHYTTARDMSLIANEAIKNDIIREVAAEVSYSGPSVEVGATPNMTIVEHKWYTHNQIINPSNAYFYKYATGFKTGFTNQAGQCLVATATMGDKDLLVVIFNSQDPGRWLDATNLFKYGFNNYNTVDLQIDEVVIQEIIIDDPIKGSDEYLNVLANETVTTLLTEEEESNVIHKIEYNPAVLSENYTDTGSPKIKAPIVKGEEIGTISYTMNNELLYEGPVIASQDINPRTFLTDLSYYYGKLKEFIFSWRIIPILATLLLISVYTVRAVKLRRRKRRRVKYKSKYNFKRRY